VKMIIETGHKINCLLIETSKKEYKEDYELFN